MFTHKFYVFSEQQEEEKTEAEKNAPKKQPLSLEEMIARREAEKKAQEKVSRWKLDLSCKHQKVKNSGGWWYYITVGTLN